ncbi:flagellar hook-basal body complex protein FliE [Alteromonas oceanisediminis]|uniref:flagellar hook-basal body complex protein FliE n=1 Tax=Alteromonas oceanisediminis TaxID=2836180 RepID=UPI001BDA1879|nr:flagellar hook-basal body complex protein FliE [Alteromonas oceanisediminis]MBT0584923.1 flagellar hook-basal body complex protein FliE [Alteromonas oceanisediminis]
MDIKGNSLYQEMQAMAGQIRPNIEQAPRLDINPSSENFADMLSAAVNNVNSMQKTSRESQQAFEMGAPDLSLADVMVAKEKAGIAFEATVQVRNKVLEAYKQIMNMPV